MNREELIARLAARIAGQRPDGVLRVAIDGPDAAGKTTLAAELAGALAGVREPIALSVDGFHRPRDVRRVLRGLLRLFGRTRRSIGAAGRGG
jgi:uridine kinase